MYLKRLKLTDFRNYKNTEIAFHKGTNIIHGENAIGKTNILEAVYMMATSKSHRGARDSELIRQVRRSPNETPGQARDDGVGSAFARIEGSFFARERDNKIESTISPTKKQFLLNRVPIKRASELIGFFSAVMFCPEDLRLIKGPPSGRRKFIDMAISQIRPGYIHKINKYNKLIDQKNHALREGEKDLWVWNEQLADQGAEICKYRKVFIEKLTDLARGHIMGISADEGLNIDYIRVGDTKEEILEAIEKNKDREIRWRQSLIGPHRDDFMIYLNDNESRKFASQGQIRSIVISLKLAEADYIKEKSGETPVVLLDDVLSELDENRQKYILRRMKDKQVMITCTEPKKLKDVNLIDVCSLRESEKHPK